MIYSSNLKTSFVSHPKETIVFSNDSFIPEPHKAANYNLDPITKIKRGLQIDPLFQYEPFHPETSSNDLRNLDELNTISKNTGFISMNAENQKNYFDVESYILQHLYQSKSAIIMYPYKFTYKPVKEEGSTETPETKVYNNGGAFTLEPELLPKDYNWNFFNYTIMNTDVNIGKAKALYDTDFAILKLQTIFEGDATDLFYESDSYASFLGVTLGKATTCLYGKKELMDYKAEHPQKTSIVYYNHTEILNNGLFSDDGSNLIGFLIIPDHILGSEDQIKEMLTDTGINKIKQFITNGGTVLVSGKSGYLLEKWELLAQGTYKTDKILTTITKNSDCLVVGYEDTVGATPDSNPDYERQLLTLNMKNRTFLISAYPMNNILSNNIKVYASFKGDSDMRIKDAASGVLSQLTDEDKSFLPFLMYKEHGKGKIILINSNPLMKVWYNEIVFNSALVAMTRNVVFNVYVKFGEEGGLPIPGGEGGIKLSSRVEFLNLYTTTVSNVELHAFLPNKVEFSSIPSGCQIVSGAVSGVSLDSTIFNTAQHLKCTKSLVDKFDKFIADIPLEILDASVTQKVTDITIIYPVLFYTDTATGKRLFLDNNGLKVEAKLGAILRGAINPDPSSTYPFPGRGYPADTVLQVENKENSAAKEVVYYGVIPLVSPIVDGVDQTQVVIGTEFYKDYYTKKIKVGSDDYTVPFASPLATEYLDFQELSGHNVILGSEWDQPVKISKVTRSEIFEEDYGVTNTSDIININYSTTADNPNIVLQQIDFSKSDKFYGHGTQRLMAFADTTKPNGAKLIYGDNIPEDIKNPNHPDRTKKRVFFARDDVYFYDSSKDYQMPTGLSKNVVISIDKYPHPQCKDATFGFQKPQVQKNGTFTHNEGLIPNEWENLLFKYCDKKQYDPTKAEDLAKLGPDVKLIHYLVPILDEEIQKPSDIMGFEQIDDYNGYLKEYNVVKFSYAHGTSFKMKASDSRQGGKLVIKLPSNVAWKDSSDPVENGYITYSADQVAFYRTEYANGEIIGYFKRGLMPNEAYGKDSSIGVTIENLKPDVASFTVDIVLYEVKYDISSPETDYEHYEERTTYPCTFEYKPYYNLPAVEIINKMNRNESTEIKEYELLMPYTRYGVYQQELIAHRTIYGYVEIHNVNNPGIVTTSQSMSTISNIGISSIPFAEHVTHGGLLIPSAPRTSRLEWRDIWGRKWAQPLRSVFPDIPPIPPPLRNFVMSTTFELLDKNGKTRMLEWPSDEEAYVHVQMKFYNSYPKFFLPTICRENRYPFFKTKHDNFQFERVYTTNPDYEVITEEAEMNREDYLIKYGFSSTYGVCYKDSMAILRGEKLTKEDLDSIENAKICSDTNDASQMKECLKELEKVKTLGKRPSTETTKTGKLYNYSPRVDSFYPKGYITEDMWDLTHFDYYDNAMEKAYKFHIDNNLPSLDVAPTQNPAYYKPHNLATFPLFKGFGYKMSYSLDYQVSKFPNYRGWWSDNLQNKDNTLLAGQSKSNDVSVGKPTLLPPEKWINWRDLKDPKYPHLIPQRLNNIYACLFNQHRVKLSPGQQIMSYPDNVYQNNIIPIIPELEAEDDRYYNYNCPSDFYQYSPTNISQVDNIVETVTDRDWLYFGVNLRGGAKENINVLMKLEPFQDSKFEGITKIQDGGRFIYYNPVNALNSFLIVDNPINTIESSRVDLKVTSMTLPTTTTTFDANIYNIYSVEDENEFEREFKDKVYTNSYGFGDSTVSVYVGGTMDSVCKLKPGDTTYVKITFINNCGFDWNLYASAIDFENKGLIGLNGNDLLTGGIHAIKEPTKYHFMTVEVPEDLQPYLNITPSDHNIQTAPQFFDFENINVATIRDGFEADYFYKIIVKDTFPDKYKGRLLTLNVTLHPEYFDQLPGPKDPTGIHDYTLQIPPIRFGIEFPTGHKYAGKIFNTFGRAHNIVVKSQVLNGLKVEDVKFIKEEDIQKYRDASTDEEQAKTELRKVWDETVGSTESIPFDVTQGNNQKIITVYFNTTQYAEFPKENPGDIDTTKFYFIVKTTAEQIASGYQSIIYYTATQYLTDKGKSKYVAEKSPYTKYSTVKGAWLKVSYSYAVVVEDANGNYILAADQKIYATDSGVVQVNVTAKNTGTKMSYFTNFELFFDEGVQFLKEQFRSDCQYTLNENSVKLESDYNINVGESYTEILYFHFEPSTTRRLAESKGRTIITKLLAGIDLTSTQGETKVTQEISTPFVIYYPDGTSETRPGVKLAIANSGSYAKPIFTVIATIDPSPQDPTKTYLYKFYRRVSGVNPSTLMSLIQGPEPKNIVSDDQPLTEEQTSSVTSYEVAYRVELYEENSSTFIASATIEYLTQLPIDEEDTTTTITTKETNKFPIWAAVLIAVLGTALVIFIGVIIYKFISKKTTTHYQVTHEMTQHNYVQEKLGHTAGASMNLDNTKRVMIKGEEVRVQRFQPINELEMETMH